MTSYLTQIQINIKSFVCHVLFCEACTDPDELIADGSKGTGLGWHADYPYHDIDTPWPPPEYPLGCQVICCCYWQHHHHDDLHTCTTCMCCFSACILSGYILWVLDAVVTCCLRPSRHKGPGWPCSALLCVSVMAKQSIVLKGTGMRY